MTFSKRLKELMEKYGISTWQLKKGLRLEEEETVRGWLRGRRPSRENIRKLSEYFGVHPAYLEYGIDDDLISYSSELQKYEPNTYDKLKQLALSIYEINKDQRKRDIIKGHKENIADTSDFSFSLWVRNKELGQIILKRIINDKVNGKKTIFKPDGDNDEDIEKYQSLVKELFNLRAGGYIRGKFIRSIIKA